MGFCTVSSPIEGIFVVTMANSDGHQYLTDDAITDLIAALTRVRDTPGLRGLVTTSSHGSFCDGLDHDAHAADQAAAPLLASRVGEAVRLLLEMPAPTAAAVSGDATSLGLAIALAHDSLVVWEDAAVGFPEARHGRRLPAYAAALLRDKVAYARLRKLLMMRAQPCTGRELVGTWYSANSPASADRDMVAAEACELLEGIEFGDGHSYAKVRQAMWPQSCAAVGMDTALPPPPSRPPPRFADHVVQRDKDREEYEASDLHQNRLAKNMRNIYKTYGQQY